MTDRTKFEIAEMKERKWEKQGGKCGACGEPISRGHYQLAHRISQTKANINRFGAKVIHHDLNLVLVCCACCNSLVSLGCHMVPIMNLIAKIKAAIARGE